MAKTHPALSRTRIRIRGDEEQGIRCLSDLHIGSPCFDEQRLKADCEDAKSKRDRIAINGDVLDLILPSDRKRFEMSALHPRLHGEDDVVGAAVEWAAELLEPYADLIDWIGIGNHESSVRKHHHICVISMLCKRLGHPKAVEYAGWSDYAAEGRKPFKLFHWHGAGKGSGKPAGLLADLGNKAGLVEDADAVWLGHFHGLAIGKLGKVARGGTRPVWLIRTPSYLDGMAARGYSSEALMQPYPTGSVRLVLEPGGGSRVEVR